MKPAAGHCVAFEPGRVQAVQPKPSTTKPAAGHRFDSTTVLECGLVWPALASAPPCYHLEACMASIFIAGSQAHLRSQIPGSCFDRP